MSDIEIANLVRKGIVEVYCLRSRIVEKYFVGNMRDHEQWLTYELADRLLCMGMKDVRVEANAHGVGSIDLNFLHKRTLVWLEIKNVKCTRDRSRFFDGKVDGQRSSLRLDVDRLRRIEGNGAKLLAFTARSASVLTEQMKAQIRSVIQVDNQIENYTELNGSILVCCMPV